MWKERQLRRRRARQLALESWHVIREVASIWTLARRATTDEFVFNCLKVGSQHATQAILDSGAFLRPKKSKPSKKPPTASMKAKKGPKEDHLAFFLTEFDNNDDHSANEEEGSYNGDSDDGETFLPFCFLFFRELLCACCLHRLQYHNAKLLFLLHVFLRIKPPLPLLFVLLRRGRRALSADPQVN